MIWSWYIEAAWVIPWKKNFDLWQKMTQEKRKEEVFHWQEKILIREKNSQPREKVLTLEKNYSIHQKKKIYTREKGSDPRDKIFDLREKELIKECTNLWKHATHETHKGTRHTRFSRFSYWMRWSKTIWICSVWATTNLFHGKQYKLSKMDGSHSLEITYLNPEILSILWNRGFSVNLSGNLFSEIAVNMTLE